MGRALGSFSVSVLFAWSFCVSPVLLCGWGWFFLLFIALTGPGVLDFWWRQISWWRCTCSMLFRLLCGVFSRQGCLGTGRRWALSGWPGGRWKVPEPHMPTSSFARKGDIRHPMLTRSTVPANDPYLDDRLEIRLSRMAMAAGDMVAQLDLCAYAEGLDNPGSGRMVAWIRNNLPAKENPFGFNLRKHVVRNVGQK